MIRRLAPGLLALMCLAGGCRKPKDDKPVAGLHAAGASLLRLERKDKEKKPVPVGAQLRAGDRVEATGPAVLEYFGGGLHFLNKGDSLEVGDAPEARLLGTSLPSRRWVNGEVEDAPPVQRIIAARYTPNERTPASALQSREPSTGTLLGAFFSPQGLSSLNEARPEGPSADLPPPPLRPKVPSVHAGPLGAGGLVAEVKEGFAVAETDELSTAVLVEGRVVPLGRTVRLVVPKGAQVVLTGLEGKSTEVEGPVDLRLR